MGTIGTEKRGVLRDPLYKLSGSSKREFFRTNPKVVARPSTEDVSLSD
jgi:hypothetical protein